MPRKKSSAARIDPKPRPIDGGIPFFNVKDKEPGRFYIWVYKAAPGADFGVEHYSYLGYELERYRDGGPSPVISLLGEDLNGKVIEMRGHVLMSCSKERHEEIEQVGIDGVSGQKVADERDDRMIDKNKYLKDAMRGINPRTRNGERGVYAEGTDGALASIPVNEDDDV